MKLLQRCAITVASSPRKYILWAGMMAFVLSYTTLYSLFSASLPAAPVPQCIDPGSKPDLYIRQALVCPPEFTNAMDPYILNGLSEFKTQLESSGGALVSPLNIDVTELSASSVLYSPKASRRKKQKKHQEHESPIVGSKGLLISYLYRNLTQAKVWENSIRELLPTDFDQSKYNSSTLFPSASNYGRDALPTEYNFFPNCPLPIFTIILIYSAGALYMTMVFSDTESVLSQAGLATTLAVEVTLAVFAALTTTSLFFPSFSHLNLRPFVALPYIVASIATENTFRLVNAISKTPPESNPLSRISVAVSIAAPTSIKKSLSHCAIMVLGLIPGIGLSQTARALCLFMVLGFFFDLCLHMTFFTAVLSVDLRRLELQDLISASSPISSSPGLAHELGTAVTTTASSTASNTSTTVSDASASNTIPSTGAIKTDDSSLTKSLKLHLKAFVYFRRIHLKQLTVVTTLLIYGSILGYLWLLSQKYISQPQAVDNPSGKFTYFLSPWTSRLSELNKGNILVYEPVVLYANRKVGNGVEPASFSLGMPLHGALTPTIADFMSMNLVVEFVASTVFILSLTALVLKFILPTSIEIPDIQELTSESVQFFSKDLVGYHTLDILQLVIQGSWIATVSLDHKLHLWNAALSRSKDLQPISVPYPTAFWPISKIVLCSNIVAVFSPGSGVFAWNFKTKRVLYKIDQIGTPIEAYFSGHDLMVVTSDSLISVNTEGEITTTLSSIPEISIATRLLTPRISEQIVCLSKSNQMFLATKHDGVWSIKLLNLVESISAMPRKDRAPYISQLNHEAVKQRKPGPLDNGIVTTRPMVFNEPLACVVPIQELHMILVASHLTASLLDVQTGVVFKHVQLGYFKQGSLRVFHSQPTYCRFCGSMSVETISISYCDSEDHSLVICHTLAIENRSRNNICLRSERDPRETRCLGFEATSESQHWIGNVEGWDVTDMNMMMGVRRKEASPPDSPIPESGVSSSVATATAAAAAASSIFVNSTTPRQRKRQKKPPLGITWEGWAMSAAGQVSYYDIPDMQNGGKHSAFSTRLLIQSIGPVVKYGRKSIAVAFGNVIKILFFGNEESFLSDVEDGFQYSPPVLKKWRRGY